MFKVLMTILALKARSVNSQVIVFLLNYTQVVVQTAQVQKPGLGTDLFACYCICTFNIGHLGKK